MQPPRSLQTMTLISLTAAATTLLMQACGGGAVAAVGPDPIIGVWNATINVKDCSSGATLATFSSLSQAHEGGTWTAEGSTFGTWRNQGNGTYAATLIFTLTDANGNPVGYQKAKVTRTLSADGNSYTSTISRWNTDLAGNTQSQGCASEVGTRVSW